jgi:uncharacterized membrane protein
VAKILLYYCHERLWLAIRWGKSNLELLRTG